MGKTWSCWQDRGKFWNRIMWSKEPALKNYMRESIRGKKGVKMHTHSKNEGLPWEYAMSSGKQGSTAERNILGLILISCEQYQDPL